jgi:hypothetical protein
MYNLLAGIQCARLSVARKVSLKIYQYVFHSAAQTLLCQYGMQLHFGRYLVAETTLVSFKKGGLNEIFLKVWEKQNSISSQTASIIKYEFTFFTDHFHTLQSSSLQSSCRRSSVLVILEAPVEPTFWNHMLDGQQLVLHFRDILQRTPSKL